MTEIDRAVSPIATQVSQKRERWKPDSGCESGRRIIPEETPIAIVHDGITSAVMMATPADIEDFAVGFSLTEGAIERLDEIRSIDVVPSAAGIEARVWLAPGHVSRNSERRRNLAGPTGCGLCGIESLNQALRPSRAVGQKDFRVDADELLVAMDALGRSQVLGAATRAVHAAGFWRHSLLTAIREDVGRHNALDKLIGGLARQNAAPDGVVLLTSRVSVEMVQKTASLGAPIVCAVSAPTALAVRTAEAAGITLVAIARSDGFEIFTHPHRIVGA